MLRSTQLRQERAAKVSEAGKLIAKADKAHRNLTAKERERFDALHAEADDLQAEIDRAERQEAAQTDITNGAVSLAVRGNGAPTGTRRDLRNAAVLGREDRFYDWTVANMGADPYPDLDIGAYTRAMVDGPQNDAERRALAEGTDSAGGYTVPAHTLAKVFDALRAETVALQAGAQIVPVTTDSTTIARIDGDSTAAWRAENATTSASDLTFGGVTFTPKTLMTLVRASRELVEDSINLDEALRKSFTGALSVKLDYAALYGDGTGAIPTGVKSTSGIGSVAMDTNGADPTSATWAGKLLDAMYEVEIDNAGPITAMIGHPRTWRDEAKLVTVPTTDYTPLPLPEKVRAVPRLTTTAIPINETQGSDTDSSTVLMGNFAELLIGLRTALRIEVLKERYADSFQYGFVAWLRADVQVVHAASFAELIGITEI